jgi:hypothetical protein
VIGERPRSPRTFPDLIEHIYGSAMLHTPNGPQHIASTVLRHCASVAFMEAMQGGAPCRRRTRRAPQQHHPFRQRLQQMSQMTY